MSSRLLRNLFSSGLQAVAIQVLGVGFFYIISLYLSKEVFGLISWANAMSMTLATLLSLGLEQIVVRRVAVYRGASWPAAAFFVHALAGSALTIVVLLLLRLLLQDQGGSLQALLLLFLAQSLLYTATPLKQFLNARERFAPYGFIALVTNALKLVLAWWAVTAGMLSLPTVALILIVCAAIELIALMFYVRRREGFDFRFRKKAYKGLVRESMPQYLSVLFDVGLSRMDWILLGLLVSTGAATADYSFAYRAFEIAKLPLLVVGMVIMPRFSRLVQRGSIAPDTRLELERLFGLEIALAVCLPLVLNIIWSPGVDALTAGKYGSVNADVFMILSFCLPLQFAINFFWTLAFAGQHYKRITAITMTSSLVNLGLNLLLIPRFAGMGAAMAFLGATLVQIVLYSTLIRRRLLAISVGPLIWFPLTGALVYWGSTLLPMHPALQVAAVLLAYTALCLGLRLITRTHLQTLMAYLKR